MIIPDDIFQADCDRLLTDWGVDAVAQVVTIVGGVESVAPTTVTVITAKQRIPGLSGAPDTFEMTITTATGSLPMVPGGSWLRWQYEGHQWDVRERRDHAGDTMTVFITRRAD
ncbi:MAG: hypothetical protein Q8K78_09180 [Planctomycetaceae bacterium]|nr:hypothetical protein [Planctomycetaceae bacterium]